MTQSIQLDAVDHKIIEHLRRHGRASNQQIAEGLGLTATTVSSRIKRMEDADQLRVVAVSDFAAHGFNFLMRVMVEVDGRPASQVAHELAWHDREARWFAAGPPASWSPAQRAEASDHYLRAHFVDPVWMLTTYGRQQALEAPPAPPKSNTGVVVAGVAFVALVGFAAWVAGRK